ncbi:MAG TPA: hypothetical protein VGB82_12825 [Alphaproteobacteria bacterium]
MTHLVVTLVAAGLLAAGPAVAADRPGQTPMPPNGPPNWPSPETEAKLRGAIDQMVGAFEQLLREVPRYGLPEITEDGDIILRRLQPPPASPPHRRGPGPEEDEART